MHLLVAEFPSILDTSFAGVPGIGGRRCGQGLASQAWPLRLAVIFESTPELQAAPLVEKRP